MRIIENKMIKKISKEKKRLIIGATGASGIPVLQKCLELIKEEEDYESWLVLTKSGELTCQQESKLSVEEIKKLADYCLEPEEIGAKPASGSFKTCGMLVVPCSMKTVAGIHSEGGRRNLEGTTPSGSCCKGNAHECDTFAESL